MTANKTEPGPCHTCGGAGGWSDGLDGWAPCVACMGLGSVEYHVIECAPAVSWEELTARLKIPADE